MAKNKEEKLSEALLKVALGYQVAEVTEEFAEVDGTLRLTKRKRTKKDVPPDLKAVQLLLSGSETLGLEGMSDEELEAEKQRLLALLEQSGKERVKKTGKATATKNESNAETEPTVGRKVGKTTANGGAVSVTKLEIGKSVARTVGGTVEDGVVRKARITVEKESKDGANGTVGDGIGQERGLESVTNGENSIVTGQVCDEGLPKDKGGGQVFVEMEKGLTKARKPRAKPRKRVVRKKKED